MRFDWDRRKAALNERKHGISFEEAQTAFFDEEALIIADPDHAGDEQRFILLGAAATNKLIVVCHCYRGADDVIRLISARRANRRELVTYRERSSL